MQEKYHAEFASPVGTLTLIATNEALVGLQWPDQKMRAHFPDRGSLVAAVDHPILSRAATELAAYFDVGHTSFSVPTAPHGDAFAQRVWEMLGDIPFGATTTYGSIAKDLGNVAFAQRVGQAVGANPIGLIIPCHRVLGVNGAVTGFSGGVEVKRWLLTHEEPDASKSDRLF